MNYTAIKNLLTQVLNKLNQWEQNAKKTQDFPESLSVDGDAYVRTENAGISKKLKIETLVNAANSGYNNQITSIGDITISGNDVTVHGPVMWKIANTTYQKTTDTVFNVPFAASGKTRIDILIATTSSTIVKVTGVETNGVAVRPNIPLNTVLVTEISVSEDALGSSTFLTDEEVAAIQNANNPSITNPFQTEDDINNVVYNLQINQADLSGTGTTEEQICEYILALPEADRIILKTQSKWNVVLIETAYTRIHSAVFSSEFN